MDNTDLGINKHSYGPLPDEYYYDKLPDTIGFEEYHNGPLTDIIGFNEDRRQFISKLSSKRISFGLIRLAFPGI